MSRPKGVIAVFVVSLFAFAAAGCGDDGATQEQLDAAKAQGAKEARDQAKLDQLQSQVKQLQKQSGMNKGNNAGGSGNTNGMSGGSSGGSSGGPLSTCATGVQVGANTSCAFAMNVAGEYGSNPGASSISAYSPVTGQYYTMSCGSWSGGGTVCTGGNGAAVYLP